MSIVRQKESPAKRGQKDARRHREKQREAIKKKLPEIISQEDIITRKRDKIVRIPIKRLDIPDFRPGRHKKGGGKGSGEDDGEGGVGVGQGPGKPGDIIKRKPGSGPGKGPGKPGQEPGEDFIETEIELAELIEMMLEDLGLPNLQERNKAELEVILGFKIEGRQKTGPWSLLDRRASAKAGMRRFWHLLVELKRLTGKDGLICFSALRQADGNILQAQELINSPDFVVQHTEIEPFPIIDTDDLRFRRVEEDIHKESQAVVIAMMDVSGSMTPMKKYLARSILFWLSEFLRVLYQKVEIRFIVHHTTARLVDEHTFFHTAESGGTRCASAYELANELISTNYPASQWNVYVWHFSDGEDWQPQQGASEARKLLEYPVNMFGYGELHVDEHYKADSNLLPSFKGEFNLAESKTAEGVTIFEGKSLPFLGVVIKEKGDVWPVLREFLKKDRWAEA